jgi:hypothetical protein
MSEAPQEETGVVARTAATWSWVLRGLGVLWGIGIVISLVQGGFAIELQGIPAKVHQQYVWLRDMLFWPVVWALRYFGLTMPWWLKDIVMAYGLGAGAYWRAQRQIDMLAQELLPRLHPELSGRPSRVRSVHWVLMWPVVVLGPSRWLASPPWSREWLPALEMGKELGSLRRLKSPHWSERRSLRAMMRLMAPGNFRWFVFLNLLTMLACSSAFFAWNYIQNAFGPPG